MKFLLTYFFLSLLVQFHVYGQSKTIQIKEGKNTVDLNTSDDKSIVLTLQINQLTLTDTIVNSSNYSYIQAEGLTSNTKIGEPNIPVFRSLVTLPNSEIPLFSVESFILTEIDLNNNKSQILPVQHHISKQANSLSSFEKNTTIYNNNDYYSAYGIDTSNFAHIIQVDYIGQEGKRFVGRINIAPVLYNPVTNKLLIYSNIKIKFYYQQTKGSQAGVFSPNINQTLLGNNNVPVSYVIVSPPLFKSAIAPLIQWKRKKGFNVIEAYTDDAKVGTTTTSIQTYLKDLYTNATSQNPAPTYILLIGDIAQLPSFIGKQYPGGHSTDYYFGEYTNDYLPEAQVGRLSGSTAELITNQVDKIIAYESYTLADPSYLGKAMVVAGNDKTYGVTHMNPQVNYATTNYVNIAHGFTTYAYLYPNSASQDADVMQKFNAGVGFVNYTGHGSDNGWNDPTFRATELAAMSNDNKFPVIINNACITNKFSIDACFCETVLRAKNKGAVACIGGSNDTYWDEDYYWSIGYKSLVLNPAYVANSLGAYDRLFHTHNESEDVWVTTLGNIIRAGNLAVVASGSVDANYYWEVYNLMGDPSLMPYLGMPTDMSVTNPAMIPVGGTSLIVNAEPNTYVAFSFNDTLYAASTTDVNGQAQLTFKALPNTGTASLVCTGQNKIPYITTIDILFPNEPYINCTSFSINDSLGNSNQTANASETIYLHLEMTNYGLTDSKKVNIVASTNNQNIQFTDSTYVCSIIKGNSTITIKNAMSMVVNKSVKDHAETKIHFTITDSLGNTWENFKTIVAKAPSIELETLVINDSLAANFNKRLEPSESAKLVLQLTNAGHADAINTTITISDTSNQLTLSEPVLVIDTIKAQTTIKINIPIEAGALVKQGIIINLLIKQQCGNYTFDTTYLLPIGFVSEDFETNPLLLSWQNTDSHPWIISDSASLSGSHCMRSGAIKDLETSTLSINYKVLQADSISFYVRTSTEKPFDKLAFYVDNTIKGEWSDETNWTYVSYNITTGNHIFKWVFTKDKSIAMGKDAVWIDKIIFPPVDAYDVAVNNPSNSMIHTTNNWTVFPNPASDGITIKSSASISNEFTLRLFDINGKLIYTSSVATQTVYIPCNLLPSGIYYLQIIEESTTEIKKIIIAK